MTPSWLVPEARIEHIALAEAGRVYVTRVLDVTATHATILDERNGSTAVVPLAILRRNYRPAPPPSLIAQARAWWRRVARPSLGHRWPNSKSITIPKEPE